MKTLSYSERLKDPRWQKKRLEILNRDDWMCQKCCDETSTLHVHHKVYLKGRMPWEYEDEQLVTLCESCHDEMPDQESIHKDVISKLEVGGPYDLSGATALVAGWINGWGDRWEHVRKTEPRCFALGALADTLYLNSIDFWKDEEIRVLAGNIGHVKPQALLDFIRSYVREEHL